MQLSCLCGNDVGQESATCSLWAKSGPLFVFVNEVLLEHCHTHFLWVFSMADFTLQWQWRSFKETMWFTKMFTSWSFIEVCWPDAGPIKGNPKSYESSLAQSTVVLSILWTPYGVTEISTWRRGKLFKSQLPFFSNSNRQLKEAHLWTKGRTLCGIRGQQQIRRGTVIGTQ